MQSTFGVNMVALVDGVPRTLSLREVIAAYVSHQREVIVRRTKFELAEKERRAHILEGLLIAIDNLDAVIELIRASRDRESARDRADGALRALRRSRRRRSSTCACRSSPRSSPTRSAPSTPTSSSASRSCATILGDEDARPGPHQGGARRDRRALRRRPPHGDHGLRGRDRHRGPDRRPADGHHDHEVRLHQVAAADDLPQAAPRRRRRDRDGHEGRRLHRAPLRVLVARLPALLLQPRQGLPLEGLRAARGAAHGEGPRAGQRPAAARGRAHPVGALHARLRRVEVPRLRDARRARSRRPSSAPTTRRSRPTASSPSRSATTTSSSPCAASTRARRS